MEEQLQNYIKNLISVRAARTHQASNFFDDFIEICQQHYSQPIHTISDMRLRNNTKIKGDIFEYFAKAYLETCYKMGKNRLVHVWLLKDVPKEVREKLSLHKTDVGIDLIAIDEKNRYYAIQAKYRKKNPYKTKTGISWKQLSTFYGLVAKTGPYIKHVVITNADYVRHIGKKTRKDQSICLGSLRKITFTQWAMMAGDTGNVFTESSTEPAKTLAELREARCRYFESPAHKS